MTEPFIVLSLPRSRSAWLAHYLSYDASRPVGHDIGASCKTLDDFFNSYSNGMIGTCETAAVIAWKIIRARLNPRILVVKRPLAEIHASLANFNVYATPGELENRQIMLNELSRQPGIETVEFRDLGIFSVAKFVFEYCLQRPWDPQWWVRCEATNIQIDMVERMKQLGKNQRELDRLKHEIRHVRID